MKIEVASGPGFGPIFGAARNGSMFGIGGFGSGIWTYFRVRS
jgi:hypothetical protein